METSYSATVTQLADLIEKDILDRRLAPGERYLTAEEVRKMFRVGKGVTNQTLQMLAERSVLTRRRRAGTFIGPQGGSPAVLPQTICVLLPADRQGLVEVPFDAVLAVMQRELPGKTIQFSFFPPEQRLTYVRELIGRTQTAGLLGGVLAVGCPYEVMRFLAEVNEPVVSFTSYRDPRWSIPAVDTDRYEGGRLLTRYLVEQGHVRMALLNFAGGSLSSRDFYDGVSDALSAAHLPHNALQYRELPSDTELITTQVRGLLEQTDPPTALIARSLRIAELTAQTIPRNRRPAPQIVFIDHAIPQVAASEFVHVQPSLAYGELMTQAARLLQSLMAGQRSEPAQFVAPVELCIPAKWTKKGK